MDKSGGYYAIYLRERLEPSWSEWFSNLSIETFKEGSKLKGLVKDQAALHGILHHINDLGLTLLAVERIECDENCFG